MNLLKGWPIAEDGPRWKYGLKRLVLAERHATITETIAREKALKAWQRAWKIRLIEESNLACSDLFEHLALP